MSIEIQAEVLVSGAAVGEALVLDEALSFWGGFDPAIGLIIDVHHPQFKQAVTEKVLFVPQSRGSAGTPGGVAETLRNGSGPLAFVLAERDVNIGVGVLVANQLYDMSVPVILIEPESMSRIASGDRIEISKDRLLTIA